MMIGSHLRNNDDYHATAAVPPIVAEHEQLFWRK